MREKRRGDTRVSEQRSARRRMEVNKQGGEEKRREVRGEVRRGEERSEDRGEEK
jgi:hypothetical protein